MTGYTTRYRSLRGKRQNINSNSKPRFIPSVSLQQLHVYKHPLLSDHGPFSLGTVQTANSWESFNFCLNPAMSCPLLDGSAQPCPPSTQNAFFSSPEEQRHQERGRHCPPQSERFCEQAVQLTLLCLSFIISKWELQPLTISSGCCEDKLR